MFDLFQVMTLCRSCVAIAQSGGERASSCLTVPAPLKFGTEMNIGRYRPRDQDSNFYKFKMADGRHFENSFIAISQPWIIRFRENLVSKYTFQFPGQIFVQKNRNFANSRYGRTPYCNRFLAIYRHNIGRLMRNLERRWRITCRYRSRDQQMWNRMQIEVTWPKPQFSTIQHGGSRYVESSFSVFKHTRHSYNEFKLSDVFQ